MIGFCMGYKFLTLHILKAAYLRKIGLIAIMEGDFVSKSVSLIYNVT